jgi:C1A family cysteine protease
MKAILALLALVVVASAMTDRESWSYFQNKYQKSYKMAANAYRFQVFTENLRKAEKLQAENPSAIYGITKFSDLTSEEFHARYANLNATEYKRWVASLPKAHFSPVKAGNVDWRGKAVASVKDQEQCGSCWAFSAAAAMEGCAMIKNGGTEVDVSAQQIVDCCQAGGSDGCNGGYPQLAVQWATSQDMATWDSYPYTAEQGDCQTATDIAVPSGTCKYVAIGATEKALQSALSNGPVSIALDADVLQSYSGGIISGSDCSGTSIDHAVFMVAWVGTTYTIKNSWGEDWGESGFFRCVSGKNCLDLDTMSSMALPN